MSISVIEQAKIQAQALMPLVKALQAELGEARANPLAASTEFYKALGEPELGFLLVCTADFATTEGFDPDVGSCARRQSCKAQIITTSIIGATWAGAIRLR